MNEIFLNAVIAGHAERVRDQLAEDPALIDERDARGVSALLLALYHGRDEIVGIVREGRAALDRFEAAALGEVAQLRALLADGDVDRRSPDGFTPLHLACYFGVSRGGPEVVSLLLEAGADVTAVAENGTRVQALHSALAGAGLEVVERLLDAGADVNARQAGGWTPLHTATRQADAALIRLLLDRGADPSLAPGA